MKYLLIVFIVNVCLLYECSADWQEIKDTLGQGIRIIKGTVCLTRITNKLKTDCLATFHESISGKNIEGDDYGMCCSYRTLQSCVSGISESECGSEAQNVAHSFLHTIGQTFEADDCFDYGFITCNMWLSIGVAVGALVGVVVVTVWIWVWCRVRKFRANNLSNSNGRHKVHRVVYLNEIKSN
ncbi:unnamed protein product, partial [Oppiella nova]